MTEAATRRASQTGVSRAGLALVGAVVAAALVLTGGALRSRLEPSPPATAPIEGSPDGTMPTLSRPPVAAATASTPTPPEPTEIADVRGRFVGPLGHVEACPILFQRDGALELVLPDGYRSRIRAGAVELIDPGGAVMAVEGDLLGVNGEVRGGGSSCLAGPRLNVSRIVEVRPRETQ